MDATHTLTLSDFLLARIAEDVAEAPTPSWHGSEGACLDCGGVSERRWLAECEAKRRIVEDDLPRPLVVGMERAQDERERVLRLLALPYADHPDYREEWRA